MISRISAVKNSQAIELGFLTDQPKFDESNVVQRSATVYSRNRIRPAKTYLPTRHEKSKQGDVIRRIHTGATDTLKFKPCAPKVHDVIDRTTHLDSKHHKKEGYEKKYEIVNNRIRLASVPTTSNTFKIQAKAATEDNYTKAHPIRTGLVARDPKSKDFAEAMKTNNDIPSQLVAKSDAIQNFRTFMKSCPAKNQNETPSRKVESVPENRLSKAKNSSVNHSNPRIKSIGSIASNAILSITNIRDGQNPTSLDLIKGQQNQSTEDETVKESNAITKISKERLLNLETDKTNDHTPKEQCRSIHQPKDVECNVVLQKKDAKKTATSIPRYVLGCSSAHSASGSKSERRGPVTSTQSDYLATYGNTSVKSNGVRLQDKVAGGTIESQGITDDGQSQQSGCPKNLGAQGPRGEAAQICKTTGDTWFPSKDFWPEIKFPNYLQLSEEVLPQVGLSGDASRTCGLISQNCSNFSNCKILVVPDGQVRYAIWKGRHVKVDTAKTSDIFLGWHKKEQKFLCIKLCREEDAPSTDEILSKATTALFLNGTFSTPMFFGIIYASDSTKYLNMGLVEEFIGTDLVPTTLKALVENMSVSSLDSITERGKKINNIRAVRICINILDQLQKVHEYGVVLNSIPPDTILLQLDDNNHTIPHFTHLSDVTFQTNNYGTLVCDPVASRKTISNIFEETWPPKKLHSDIQLNHISSTALVSRSRRADDLLAVGKILYAVGCVTELHTLIWLGETCIQSRPAVRPGIRSMRILLVKLLRQVIDETLESTENDTNNVHPAAPECDAESKVASNNKTNETESYGKRDAKENKAEIKQDKQSPKMENYTVLANKSEASIGLHLDESAGYSLGACENMVTEVESDSLSEYAGSDYDIFTELRTSESEFDGEYTTSYSTTEYTSGSEYISVEESVYESDFPYTENSSEVGNVSDSTLKDSDFDTECSLVEEY